MEPGQCFSDTKLAQLRKACREAPAMAALYAFDLRGRGECNLAALFTETPDWPERLELEMAVAKALDLQGIELINLRRMPLVGRFNVVDQGEPLYVGHPEVLAVFIEETVVRYSAFYPLLEALYWKVETKPLVADQLNQ
jgi:hypothetical protein